MATVFQRRFELIGEYSVETIIDSILESFPEGEQALPSDLYGQIWEPPLPELKALEGYGKTHRVLFRGLGEIAIQEKIKEELERAMKEGRESIEKFASTSYPRDEARKESCIKDLLEIEENSRRRTLYANAYLETQGIGREMRDRRRHLQAIIPSERKTPQGHVMRIRELADGLGLGEKGRYRTISQFEWLSTGTYMCTKLH